MSGATQRWQTTAGRDGTYRAFYPNISDDQLRQIREFFDVNKLPALWQCVSHEQVVLENCYFLEGQEFPKVIKDAAGGNTVDLVFGARYEKSFRP